MRHTSVRTLLTTLAVVLTTAGCGGPGQADGGSAGAPAVAACRGAARVVRVDLDGDGAGDRVSRCGDRLVGDVRGRRSDLDLAGLRLVARGARVVRLQGGPDLLLLRSGSDATGWAPHLFGLDGGRLGEVRAAGRPLLPRVTTAPGRAPMTARCVPGGRVVVVTASVHQPPGFVLAWDLTRTSYRIVGGTALRQRSTEAVGGADPAVRRRLPHLFDGRLFAGCSSAVRWTG